MASWQLSPAHKTFLLQYCDDYDEANDAGRRKLREKAANQLIEHFRITEKEHVADVPGLVMVWLYEKVLRQRAGTSAGRFGISLVARPRELYAMEERQNINAIVNARLAGETEEYRSTNRIGTRATVVKELWEALPDERREAWAEYGRTIEAGTGTLQMKDDYAKKHFLKFLLTFLKAGQRLFDAHLLCVTARPRADGSFVYKCIETPTLDKATKTFLDCVDDGWAWTPRDFSRWKAGTSRASGSSEEDWVVYHHETGEPLLPSYKGCGIMSMRSLLRSFMNAHFHLVTRSKKSAPWEAIKKSPHRFFPEGFIPSDDFFKVHQPKRIDAKSLEAWLDLIWYHQELYVNTKDIAHRFRVLAIPKNREYVPAVYDDDYMLQHARDVDRFYGSDNLVPIRIGGTDRQRAGSDASEASDMTDNPSEIAEDPMEDLHSDDVFDVPEEQGDEEAPSSGAVSTPRPLRELGVNPDAVSGRAASTPVIKRAAPADLVGSPTPRAGPSTSVPSSRQPSGGLGGSSHGRPRSPSPGASDSEETTDTDADPFASFYAAKPRAMLDVTSGDAPSCTNSDLTRRFQFLGRLWTNATYQRLLKYHNAGQTKLADIRVADMPWVSWESDATFLPQELHLEDDVLRRTTSYIHKLQASIRPPLTDFAPLETFLLIVGLLAREVTRLHFTHDADSPEFPLPVDLAHSQLTPLLHSSLDMSLTGVWKRLSSRSRDVATTTQPVIQPLLLPSTNKGKAVATRPRPRPRGSAPRPEQEGVEGTPEELADNEHEGSGVDLRKSRRNPVPTRRYADYEPVIARKPRSMSTSGSEDEPLATRGKGNGAGRGKRK